MRPTALRAAYASVAAGTPLWAAMAGFLDAFYGERDGACRLAMLAEEPQPTADPRQDALAGAIAEYLAKRYRLPAVPPWAGAPGRALVEPWFTAEDPSPGLRAYLAWTSPAEFRWRNIYTEAEPPRLTATCGRPCRRRPGAGPHAAP